MSWDDDDFDFSDIPEATPGQMAFVIVAIIVMVVILYASK